MCHRSSVERSQDHKIIARKNTSHLLSVPNWNTVTREVNHEKQKDLDPVIAAKAIKLIKQFKHCTLHLPITAHFAATNNEKTNSIRKKLLTLKLWPNECRDKTGKKHPHP